jgi:hypothetical protein
VFINTFPFTVSLPHPNPFPLPVLCSVPLLTPPHVLLTLTIVSVVAIAWTVPSSSGRSVICPVSIIIILIEYLIPIQSSNGQEISWLVLPATWRLNYCPDIIATISRKMIPWVANSSRAGCLPVMAINLISEGTGIVPLSIVQFIPGVVKRLQDI